MPTFDQTPDKPRAFGFKVSWFAVPAGDPASFLDALDLKGATPANWASGLEAVYGSGAELGNDRWLFVSPPVNGWVLAVSNLWAYPVVSEAPSLNKTQYDIGRKFDVAFGPLMRRFDDVQFLGSYRVVGFVTWARALKGKPHRVFAFGDGGVTANIGNQTAEEAQLGFVNLGGLAPSDATERIYSRAEEQHAEESRLAASGLSYPDARAKMRQSGRDAIPDESDVGDLAALWSIDPTKLDEQDHPPGVGLVVRLPAHLSQ